jgi:hypothetical protein
MASSVAWTRIVGTRYYSRRSVLTKSGSVITCRVSNSRTTFQWQSGAPCQQRGLGVVVMLT